MKSLSPFLYVLLFCLCLNFMPAQVVLPYMEGFEQVGPDTIFTNNQLAINGLSGQGYSWSYFKPDGLEGRLQFGTYTGFANNGRRAATLDDYAPNTTYSSNELILTVDLSNYSGREINLQFSYLSHHEDSLLADSVWVRGSLSDPWVPVYDLYGNRGVPNLGLDGIYKEVKIGLSKRLQAAGQSIGNMTQVKFGQGDNSSAVDPLGADGITIDDVVVSAVEPVDVGIDAIYSTSSSCQILLEPATLVVHNYGSDTVHVIPLAVSINDTLVLRDTMRNQPLAPGAFASYAFSQLVNMSLEGDYQLRGWAELPGEQNRFNDSSGTSWLTSHLVTIDQYPFFEDFRDSVTPWYSNGYKDSWVRSVEDPCSLPDTFGGFYTYKFRPELLQAGICDAYGHGIGERSYLYSGTCFDFGLNPSPVVRLDLTTFLEQAPNSGSGGMILESSINDGLSWQRVGGYKTGINWYNDSSVNSRPAGSTIAWTGKNERFEAEHYLFDLAGENSVRFRMALDTDSGGGWYVRMSDFYLYELPSYDAKVTDIVTPTKECDLGGAESLTIRIVNRGYDSLRTLPVAYRVNGGPVVRDTLRGVALALDDSLNFTFSQALDLSTPGGYTIKAWAEPGSSYTLSAQDTLTRLIRHLELVQQYPFFDDLEDSALNWFSLEDTNSWALTSPRMTHVNGSPRGGLSWVTARDGFPGTGGTYSNESSYLYVGNCFDLSGMSDPVVEFDINWYFDGGQGHFEYSLDDGASWYKLGDGNTGENWYNQRRAYRDSVTGQLVFAWFWQLNDYAIRQTMDVPRWRTARHPLTSLAGEPEVRFRFYSEFLTRPGIPEKINEGFAIDNFAVYESVPEDASMLNVLLPRLSCDPATPQPISVVIRSHGTDTLRTVPLAARLGSGGNIVRDTFRGTLAPGQVDTFDFSAFSSTSLQGGYTFSAWAELPGDPLAFNDTFHKKIEQPVFVNQFPYYEGFEQGEGGWFSYGELNTWRRVIPGSSIDITPQNDLFAWISHGDDTLNHTGGEGGYVESPCFDFSNLQLPLIHVDLNVSDASFYFGTNSFFDGTSGTKMQYSLDNGLSWLDLGELNQTWYNYTEINSFPDTGKVGWASFGGLSPYYKSWFTASTMAPELAMEPEVKLRVVYFTSAFNFSRSRSVAFDNIRIMEAPIDISLGRDISPSGGCQGGNLPVCIEVENNSGFPVINPRLSYRLNNGRVVSEILQDTLQPLSTTSFCFTRTAKIVAGIPARITAWSEYAADTVNHNDTTVSFLPGSGGVISAFPYLENFDGPQWVRDSAFQATQFPKPRVFRQLLNGWANDPTDNSGEWLVWNQRNSSAFPPDNAMGGGHYLQAAYDSLDYSSEQTLFTPCFDISMLQNPEMRVKVSTGRASLQQQWRGLTILYLDLIHNGTLISNFATLDYNGFNLSWNDYHISLAGYQGEVQFRFRTNSALQPMAAIDEFEILDVFPDDIALRQLLEPHSGECSSTGNEVWVKLENIGTGPQTGFPVIAESSIGTRISGIYSDTLLPGEQVDFLIGALSTLPGGLQTITVYSNLAADSVRANDTLHTQVELGQSTGQLQALPDSIVLCQPDSVALGVMSPDPLATYTWYDAGGNLLAVGDSLKTGPVQQNTRFEVEASYNRPALMISEVNTAFPWHIEIKNMTQGEIDARGWRVYIQNPDIVQNAPFSWNLLHFGPQEVQYRDGTLGPNTLGGGGLFFNPLALSGRGYVALVDDQCNVVDVVFFGYSAQDIAGERLRQASPCFGIIPLGPHWSGDGVTSSNINNLVMRRTASVDNDMASDWTAVSSVTPGIHPQVSVRPACVSPRDSVVVMVQPAIAPLLADQQVCGGATLDAGAGYASYLWSTGDTRQVLSLPDTTLAVSVIVTDANGCTASDTAQISTLPGPDPGLLPAYSFCDSGSIAVDTALAGLDVRWSTSDTIAAVLVQNTGNYSVAVVDTAGCVGRDTTQVTILASPIVDLGSADTTLCTGAILDAGIFANAPMYQWNTGDTTRFTATQNPGMYTVSVRDSNACEATDSIDVQFFGLPAAGFTYTGINPYQFNSAATGSGLSYRWHFGDGDSSSLPNPGHSYATGGRFVVCLTVTDTCGEQSVWCDSLDIATGIDREDFAQIHIYPNPARRYVYIEADAAQNWEEAQVWDAKGKLLVIHALVRNGEVLRAKIDLQHYAEGLYFIRLKAGDKTLSRRIVKGN